MNIILDYKRARVIVLKMMRICYSHCDKEELVSEADKVCQKLRWQLLYLDKYIENTTGENVLDTANEI